MSEFTWNEWGRVNFHGMNGYMNKYTWDEWELTYGHGVNGDRCDCQSNCMCVPIYSSGTVKVLRRATIDRYK